MNEIEFGVMTRHGPQLQRQSLPVMAAVFDEKRNAVTITLVIAAIYWKKLTQERAWKYLTSRDCIWMDNAMSKTWRCSRRHAGVGLYQIFGRPSQFKLTSACPTSTSCRQDGPGQEESRVPSVFPMAWQC